jgi:1,2-diacylglycerol 3-alpha-glucosyltransferase
MKSNNRLRIAFFGPIIAHYRSGLIRELKSDKRCDFHWFADSVDAYDNIPTLDLSSDRQFTRCPYWRLGPLRWQSQTVKAAFQDFDAYIFTGGANWISSWIGAVIARARGKRVLFWTHGWMRFDSPAKRLIRNAMYRIADGLLLYGERARDIGAVYGFNSSTLHVMYNSLDFDKQQQLVKDIARSDCCALRESLFGTAETPVVIAMARLTPSKYFGELINAAGVLKKRGTPINLLVVGDGPERATLEALAKREEVRAAFVGACYDEQLIAKYLLSSNVTVSPGNVGLTCMHSLGYGVPVITHDQPDDQMPEWEAIRPGINGELFKRHDVESLADAISRWTQLPWLTDKTQKQCVESLRSKYHPRIQCASIVNALLGNSATNTSDLELPAAQQQ